MTMTQLATNLATTAFKAICPNHTKFFVIMTPQDYWEWVEDGGVRNQPIEVTRKGVTYQIWVTPWYAGDLEIPAIGAGIVCEGTYMEIMHYA